MPLINTAGLTILGDGSQWFWSMLAFFAIPITGYMIFSQLRAQRSANRVNAMKALREEWDSERMVRHRLAVMLHNAGGVTGTPPALSFIGNWFEQLGYLATRGDVHVEDIWQIWGGPVQVWWLRNEAWIAEERRRTGPLGWRNWERLVGTMADLDRRHGNPPIDVRVDSSELSWLIPELIERLRLEQEIKSAVVPAWSPPPVKAADEAHSGAS